jgi:hypothetical protein
MATSLKFFDRKTKAYSSNFKVRPENRRGFCGSKIGGVNQVGTLQAQHRSPIFVAQKSQPMIRGAAARTQAIAEESERPARVIPRADDTLFFLNVLPHPTG